MTEYDLFVKCIPMIAGIAVRCRRMEAREYEEWKRKTLENAPETVKAFIRKVITVIDLKVLGFCAE